MFKIGDTVVILSAIITRGVILSVEEDTEYATVRDNYGDTVCYPWSLLSRE